jgi:pre-rRNA-processing protein TSR1
MALDATSQALSTPTDQADDLTATNIPDTSMNEQTWPTEEEIGTAPAANGDGKRMKRVPKGTSAYQAAWIFDDEDDEGDDDVDEDEDEDMEGVDEADEEEEGEMEETEEIELDERTNAGHEDLNPEEEEREYVAFSRGRVVV